MADLDFVSAATVDDLVVLARNELARGRAAHCPAASDTDASQEHPNGVTIDLGYRKIQTLPAEVIDVIKDECARLALSHNLLSSLPPQLSRCTRLRYLNLRSNSLREFPEAILQLSSLEILDISKNKIRVLPPEIGNLKSLKVFSIQKTRIEQLPVGLADINSLQVLKLYGLPLTFPPPDICAPKKDTPIPADENQRDVAIWAQVKRYLRQHANRERMKIESDGDTSENNVEKTPRPPKRSMFGRFPVRPSVSGIDTSDLRPQSAGLPPPIPNKDPARFPSVANMLSRRPGVPPLITNLNERGRSQSESLFAGPRSSKRMGLVTKKTSEPLPVGELLSAAFKRRSHYRGVSHGSALRSSGLQYSHRGDSSSSPASPVDVAQQHALYFVRPLSSLTEEKRESRAPDVAIRAGKSILYSIFQIYRPLRDLIKLVRDVERKRSRLECLFFSACSHLEELDRQLANIESLTDDDGNAKKRLSTHSVMSSCLTCIQAHDKMSTELRVHVRHIIHRGEPMYVRSLLLLIYGSLVEARNACSMLGVTLKTAPKTPKLVREERLATPTQSRPVTSRRLRSATVLQSAGKLRTQYAPPPVPLSVHNSRSNTMTSLSAATPRSGESFSTLSSANVSRSNTMQSTTMQSHMYDQPEEQQFERIFLRLQAACDLATDALPICRYTFDRSRDLSERAMQVHATRLWRAILEKCDNVITAVQTLKERLSRIKLKDPAARAERGFWQICTTFAWKDLAEQAKHIGQDGLAIEHVKMLMRPIQKAVKEASIFISASPWAYLASTGPLVLGPPISLAASEASTPTPYAGVPGVGLHGASTGVHAAGAVALHRSASAAGSAYGAPNNNSHAFTHNAALPTPGYATPLSAALGPAAQATVPSTPGGAQGQMQGPGGYFQGTGIVFERADRLLAGGMAGRRG